ncbi:Na+-transporting NADH:ubiquinone oxidoreductase subunit F [Tissierella praeacuta DSM 18095]|uniref:Na+-transporting NADH:ubiquinone oxidoreductase subunit F n=1 Tax=Tissierella praeacuta DSM 18095 TaxID=1123404 RepID=A0A1M4S568_9FIRM|nr:2Fe-2S iron-sulfur cluster binding domain-containing protein [Tissierella praeacuta]SHE27157.1 Na+-transporting NADH:ubiquinone oxidoreductase subunit F [Tissierella praeacuta DSM 18095]SUP00818.1 Phenol hydroxylase P5 protein [Tissierella praeacuta]
MNEIIITTATVTGISAIFAFLLTLADKTIGNYGEVKLTINNDKEYIVNGGSSLLSTLIEEKIFIPSACGGKGTCGYCKVKVIDGGGPVLPTETPFLTEDELKDNIRLSCQCKVKENIKIQIPEELFNVKEYIATVEEIEDMTSVIKRLRIRLPEGEEIKFKPGQFIQFKAPIYDGNDEEVYRAYSIASSPSDKGYIELFIGYVPGGKCTTYVHKHLKVGDTVQINGPYGDFYFHDDNDREVILVAAGTGIAPILSILKHMKEYNINRKARFYFGAKTPDDLFLLDYFKELEETLFDFKFIPTLSRVSEEHNWTGEKGRVNNTIERHLESPENKEAYLCGNPPMIDSMVKALVNKGLPEELIYFDKFD